MNIVREIGRADDEQLAGIRAAVTYLLDAYEPFMGGDLVEGLCLWREAAQRQQAHSNGPAAEVKRLRTIQAS